MKTIDLVSWLKKWFYTKEESYNKTAVDSLIEEKLGNTGFGRFYINDEGHLIYDTEAT